MTTFVLLHGAYQGGWIWQNVAPHLRAAGQGQSTGKTGGAEA